MPVHIENMTSEVTVLDGDFPLNEAQIEKLVQLIMQRMEAHQQAQQYQREATTLRRQSVQSLTFSE